MNLYFSDNYVLLKRQLRLRIIIQILFAIMLSYAEPF